MIGTADLSISGNEAEAVEVAINAAGHELLSAAHGRLSGSLAILELPPSPQSTLTKTVQLVQQQTHIKKSK